MPFVDLHAQYLSIKEEVDNVISDVIQNSSFIRGPYVDKFEGLFSQVAQKTLYFMRKWDRCSLHCNDGSWFADWR